MSLFKFVVYFVIAMVILLICIVVGDHGPWYFAWLLGTAMIILIAVCGAVLYEGQEVKRSEQGDVS